MKLAVVVQRYGPAIHGGAERHARYLAEHLAQHADVEVLTTCASSDITWANEFSAGTETVDGVSVRRFRVSSPTSASASSRLTERVFRQTHSLGDELRWLQACAPVSRPLVRYLRRHGDGYDFCLFVGYRYCDTYYGMRAVPSRAILVPRAEPDPSIGAHIFGDMFRAARAILYNSTEERSLVQAVAGNPDVPSVVIGAGADVPANPQPGRFRQKRNIRGPFALYVGSLDERRCGDLFTYFDRFAQTPGARLSLVIVGEGPLPVPTHPKIKHVGALDDAEKFDAMAAAETVIVPSRFHSLSRTAVEAWALGKPVLANGSSKALSGQCVRSNGGLCYCSSDEFTAMLQALDQNRWLNASLGKNGRQYVRDTYDWRVIERKYHDLLLQLQKNGTRATMRSVPGWLARRRRDRPPSSELVQRLG
ncbi:MAG TPA: glycosyltransferase family 4 protein [Vicinamibacterales bacterium]|nr:glycosyltransferase family 4 protein [Vicinamibacterales bacterium]